MIRKFRFALVDAFAEKALTGNPCAVVLDADSLSEGEMQKIAKEMNQSETAFILKSEKYDLKARYFTPEREIPLAGHPTIATIHAALENKVISLTSDICAFNLELNEGPIKVEVEKNNQSHLIRMFQRKPIFGDIHDPQVVLPLFGLEKDDLFPNSPIQTVSTGTPQLMIFVKGHEQLKKVKMEVDGYKKYRQKMNFFSPHIFCLPGISTDALTFARHPGVAPDTGEDAFTGSATGGMAAYLWKHQFINKAKFIAEQGHWMGRPGRAYVEVIGSPNDIETVSVTGHAITTVTGILTL